MNIFLSTLGTRPDIWGKEIDSNIQLALNLLTPKCNFDRGRIRTQKVKTEKITLSISPSMLMYFFIAHKGLSIERTNKDKQGQTKGTVD